jgi:hypothetical protein
VFRSRAAADTFSIPCNPVEESAMQYIRLGAVVVLAPALAAFLAVGCSGEKKSDQAAVKSSVKPGKKPASGGQPAKAGAKEALVAKGWGSLKGKVTYAGSPPEVKQITIPDTVKEKDKCLMGDTRDQTWKIGVDKGVADVVVWLRAPKGKYFQIPADQQKPAEKTVKLDQPFCAFEPHVFTLYPSFFDGKEQKSTGQEFTVVNSADFLHNTNWTPSDELLNSGANQPIQAKKDLKIPPFKPSEENEAGGEQKIAFKCNVHTWMSAYAWVLDHPYVAVTSGDAKDAKVFGTYEIKKVPAGVEVEVVYWHQAVPDTPKVLKTVTLKEGDNTEDFTVSQ